MADSAPVFGTLGKTALPYLLWSLAAKNTEAQQFGWGQRGAGGTYRYQQNFVMYQPHRAGAVGIQMLPFEGQITYGDDIPDWCAVDDVLKYAHQNLFCPFWFFEWCKQYLAILRTWQPKFDATVEAKLVWTTQAAWVINAALGATNLHGSILPSALYEHISGEAFDEWAGDGSYMYTAQHGAVLAKYWKDAWTDAAQATLAKTSNPILLDSGFKVLDRNFNVQWESSWRGSLFPAPLEAQRFRYDPILSVQILNNFKADGWEMKGLAGAHYNDTIENDPWVVRSSTGKYANDNGMALLRYSLWSQFMPWLQFRAFGGTDTQRAAQYDSDGASMLSTALTMATLFSPGMGLNFTDQAFWKRLEEWKQPAHQQPALVQTAIRTDINLSLTKAGASILPIYSPNHELSFRYFYPAMIDLVLACDYYKLIETGVNTWWKYNINSGAGVGTFKATEDTEVFDPKTGAPRRDKNGVLYGAPIVPTGAVQEQHQRFQDEQEKQKSMKIAINLAQTFIAIFQAVYGGNYGALVSAGQSWYKSFSEKFPVPEDSWRGVVPPTPLVQRRIPSFGFTGNQANLRPTVPYVSGRVNTVAEPLRIGGGATVLEMMATVRAYIFVLARFGAPFTLTAENNIELEGIQHPVTTLKPNAPRSIVFGPFPIPGFEPGSKVAQDVLDNPVVPPKRSKGGLLILAFGFTSAMVGVLVAKRRDLNLRPWRRHG